MFKQTKNSNMSDTANFDTNTIDRIAEGTVVEGNLNSIKGIRIDGKVIGNVSCDGKIVVGKKGIIEGDVKCINADIEGQLKSSIEVQDLLDLKASGIILGEIATGRLSIEPGATFTGSCKMGGKVKGIQENNKEKTLGKEKTA